MRKAHTLCVLIVRKSKVLQIQMYALAVILLLYAVREIRREIDAHRAQLITQESENYTAQMLGRRRKGLDDSGPVGRALDGGRRALRG
jgi:hypothetical protein